MPTCDKLCVCQSLLCRQIITNGIVVTIKTYILSLPQVNMMTWFICFKQAPTHSVPSKHDYAAITPCAYNPDRFTLSKCLPIFYTRKDNMFLT